MCPIGMWCLITWNMAAIAPIMAAPYDTFDECMEMLVFHTKAHPVPTSTVARAAYYFNACQLEEFHEHE